MPPLVVLALLLGWTLWPRGAGPDLIVYGATPQGVMAAVTAARQGERVLLLEPGTGVGGQLTQAWLATLDMSTDARGNPFAQGLFHEFFRGLRHDNSFDVPTAQALLDRLLTSAGVQVQLGTDVTQVKVNASRITQLTTQDQDGPHTLAARQVIDASDTAALAALAGARFTLGREDTGLGHTQMAATLVFRIRGADLSVLAKLVHQERGREDGRRNRSLRGLVALTSGYQPSDPARFFLRGFNASVQMDGSLLVNALLIYGVDGTSKRSVQRAYQDGILEAGRVVRYLHETFPAAFGQASLGGAAPRLYLRESRHLLGSVRLTAADVLYGHRFRDAVAVNAYPLDGQAYLPGQAPYLLGTPRPYEVPFGTMLPLGFRNLLVVSQAASFGSVAAFSARVVPLQMTLGEAAGQASVLAHWLRLDYPAIDQGVWTGLLRGLLRLHHARVNVSPSAPPVTVRRGCPDASQPGAVQAAALLSAGLMSSPYYYVGCLYLDEPETTLAFLNDLQHAGRSGQDALFRDLRVTLPPGQQLSAGLARTLLARLGLSAPPQVFGQGPAARLLKRAEVAALRWSLLQPGPPPP